jgi:putative ABC transport system substrate-binding protein
MSSSGSVLNGSAGRCIITVGDLATCAALSAAQGTPIVLSFAANDPVEAGFASSLARPGGGVTGIFFRALESDAKRLELLTEILPAARVFGFVAAPTLEPAREELLARTAATLRVSLITPSRMGPAIMRQHFKAI